ncbi:MAG TPA: HEAT repeat domain-containing protein, partial [Candidatus Baltobacteraceae bacterium]|nr:HEAT repeat domain-containing protein [Candidatus Baltobacteraceae bacterium]
QNVIDPGELAGALKVLAAIGTQDDASLAAKLASNADWRVRVQVANALGALNDASQIPVLTGLIDDTHWWVRYRAAQALAKVSKEDETRLRTILKHITDKYGRDILTQIIAEQETVFQRGAAS